MKMETAKKSNNSGENFRNGLENVEFNSSQGQKLDGRKLKSRKLKKQVTLRSFTLGPSPALTSRWRLLYYFKISP